MLSTLRYCSFFAVHLSALMLFTSAACAFDTALSIDAKRHDIVITSYVDPNNIGYSRRAYENELIELLLAKTQQQDNTIRTQRASFNSNSARELRIMQEHPEIRFIRSFAANDDLVQDKNLRHIAFPIMRGALSYRICLTSKTTQRALASSPSLQEFKRFTHVQGLGWLDTKILRHAGFTVIEAGAYGTLVEMVVRERADLLCRGVNEVQSDWFEFNRELASLVIDESYLIFYPLPRYFFTHVKNKALLDRIEQGLTIARKDGSFMQLWEKHHLLGLQKSQLDTRHLIVLENPFIDKLDGDYRQHFYTLPHALDNRISQSASSDKKR